MKYLAFFFYSALLIFIAFVPEQHQFELLISCFSAAFIGYIILVTKEAFSLKFLLFTSIILRIILIFAFPNLSDDIYRFIWDGELLQQGINPYNFTPRDYLINNSDPYFEYLFDNINSPDYYSVYPPFSQLIFYFSTLTKMDSLLVSTMIIKGFLLVAELITMIYGLKLLELLKLPKKNILWYALNPLIIIEVVGNCHFEGFMVCFFVLFLYFLSLESINKAALFVALSIATKLIPLIFLPYFLFNWKWEKVWKTFSKIGALSLLFFIPVLYEFSGFGQSLDLYFSKFEFNASVYYVLRSLGQILTGYNRISVIGPFLASFTFIGILFMAYKTRKLKIDFFHFSMFALTLYLLLSTTVHPWYLCLGVILSVFTNFKYFILWSFLIVLSYSKYLGSDVFYYSAVSLEYFGILVFMYLEFERHKGKFQLQESSSSWPGNLN